MYMNIYMHLYVYPCVYLYMYICISMCVYIYKHMLLFSDIITNKLRFYTGIFLRQGLGLHSLCQIKIKVLKGQEWLFRNRFLAEHVVPV